jgi:flagellar biosynthetic protein FliR
MLLTGAEISAFVGTYLWPFFRIAALVTAMPVFSSSFIPMRIRLIIAVALTMVIVPVIPDMPVVDAISWDGLMIILQQILIGIGMGFIFHLVINAFIIGGQIIAMQMGLGFALMVDPVNGAQAPVLSLFFMLLVTLFFVLLDGHLALIGVLAKSFYTLPVGPDGMTAEGFWKLVNWGTTMFRGAVMVALPAVTALFLVNLALGVMGRAAPQLNIFAVGFSITITAGFYMLLVSLPVVLTQFENLSVDAFNVVKENVKVE